MPTTISICSQKGGVSKSSTTIELAAVFKKKGKRVLVIDFDQQCSLTKDVGGDLSGNTIYNVLHADCEIKEAIQHLELFDLVAGSESLSRADREFIEDDDNFILSDIIEFLPDYDYIFIDNAPSRNKLLTMTYIASDYIIIPTECDESSKDSLVTTQKDVYKLVNGRHHDSHAKILGYILAKYERTAMHQIALEDLHGLAESNPDRPFVAAIRKSIKVSEVKTFHTAVTEMYKRLPIADDYTFIADLILERLEG